MNKQIEEKRLTPKDMQDLYKRVSSKSYDIGELRKLNTETMLDEDGKVWVEYSWHKQAITKSNEEAVRGFEESIFFGDTIIVDGKAYVSMEHIQKVKDNYLTQKESDEEKRK